MTEKTHEQQAEEMSLKAINTLIEFDKQIREIALSVAPQNLLEMSDAQLAIVRICRAWRNASPMISYGLGIKMVEDKNAST